jgi:hypothetical protein
MIYPYRKLTIRLDGVAGFSKDGQAYHRDADMPSLYKYNVEHKEDICIFYKNGFAHRVGAPAILSPRLPLARCYYEHGLSLFKKLRDGQYA